MQVREDRDERPFSCPVTVWGDSIVPGHPVGEAVAESWLDHWGAAGGWLIRSRAVSVTASAVLVGQDECPARAGPSPLQTSHQEDTGHGQRTLALGLDPQANDIRFVEDDWESPTLGAWGLGWEVWLNGMEVTQFTYFQEVGSLKCLPTTGEITYGLERLAMYLQKVENIFDLQWAPGITYRDVFHQNEVEQSTYNFTLADTAMLFTHFDDYEREARRLIGAQLALPAYEMVMKCSHTFNLLDARGAISVTERAAYIGRVRALARGVAQAYYESRERLGFPMITAEDHAKLGARP